MTFKYELRFAICGVHVAESLLVGRNSVFGICKLKLKKKLKNIKQLKTCLLAKSYVFTSHAYSPPPIIRSLSGWVLFFMSQCTLTLFDLEPSNLA